MSIDIKIPGYELKQRLGSGGMATVYLAVQQNFGREVALKIMAPHLGADPDSTTRFQREARIVAQMHHGNIVPVYDVGECNHHEYLAMEYLSGGELRKRINQGFGLESALKICIPLALALDYAHRKRVIHRDVKPENILFRDDGTPVLTDFGIARSADSAIALTRTGIAIGTFAYMSPEQALGKGVDGRADLYSLGIVLYELLLGVRPYIADSETALIIKHQNEPIPTLPPRFAHLQSLLDRSLAKDPSERYSTGAEMAQAMEEFLLSTRDLAPTNIRGVSGQPASGRGERGIATRTAVLIGGVSAAVLASAALAIWPGSPQPAPTLSADATSIERKQATTVPSGAAALTSVAVNAPAIAPVARRASRDDSPQGRRSESRTTGREGIAVVKAAVTAEPRDESPLETQPRSQPTPARRAEPASIEAVESTEESKSLRVAAIATASSPEQKPEPPPSVVRVLVNRTEMSATPVSEICEQTSRVDDPVEMRLAKPVPLSDGSSIPADTVLTGRIAGKRLVGNQPPLVEIEAERFTMDGRSVAVTANPFSFYMSRPSVGGRVAKGAVIGAAAGAVVGLILKKNVAVTAAGGAIAGGVIGAATRPAEACVSQTDTTFVFKVTSDTDIR